MRMNRYYFMPIETSKVSYVSYVSDKFTDYVSFRIVLHHLVELHVCSEVAKYLKNLRLQECNYYTSEINTPMIKVGIFTV